MEKPENFENIMYFFKNSAAVSISDKSLTHDSYVLKRKVRIVGRIE